MMFRAQLLEAYKLSLNNSLRIFKDNGSSYVRHFEVALADLNLWKPLIIHSRLSLVADQSLYPCPEQLNKPLSCFWGRDHKARGRPWDDDYVGQLPEIRIAFDENRKKLLHLIPSPSGRQILILGSECRYTYASDHFLTETESSLTPNEENLLVLRAQAEAMREASILNVTEPFQLREGLTSTPKNGTPAYLYKELLSEFERRVLL